jgi:hypothetical protein
MTKPAHINDDDDLFDAAEMTVAEWIEVIDDTIFEAVDDMMEDEAGLTRLAAFLKRKASEISAMAAECEPQEIDEEVPD